MVDLDLELEDLKKDEVLFLNENSPQKDEKVENNEIQQDFCNDCNQKHSKIKKHASNFFHPEIQEKLEIFLFLDSFSIVNFLFFFIYK